MTDARLGFKDGLCSVPGCFERRHISKSGRTYTKCYTHYRESYQKSYARKDTPKTPRPTVKPSQVGRTVEILITDWRTERVLKVRGVVICEEEMPKSYGDLRKIIALAAQENVYVAQTQAYKTEDLVAEKEDRK